MTPQQWNALSEAEKDVWRRRFRRERQQRTDYERYMGIWYARSVYHVGQSFLVGWLLAGTLGIGIFGLLFLCMAMGW